MPCRAQPCQWFIASGSIPYIPIPYTLRCPAACSPASGSLPVRRTSVCLGLTSRERFYLQVMMMFAVLPWWGVFRKWPLYRRCALHLSHPREPLRAQLGAARCEHSETSAALHSRSLTLNMSVLPAYRTAVMPHGVIYRALRHAFNHVGQCTENGVLFMGRALPGLNAAAVGLLVAAAFQLTFQARQTSAAPTTSICIGACLVPWYRGRSTAVQLKRSGVHAL